MAAILSVCLLVSAAGFAATGSPVATSAKHSKKCKKRAYRKSHPRRCHRKRPAKPQLPAKFFGVNPNSGIPSEAAFAKMRAGRISSHRTPIYWSSIEYEQGTFVWTELDRVIARAARAGVEIMPFFWGTPRWLGTDYGVLPIDTPAARQAWTDFLRTVIGRYGPGGQFWAEHGPGTADPLPTKPIRVWQLWNEQNYFYFATPASPERYGEFLKLSSAAIRGADPGAKIVTGGMFGRPSNPYPEAMYATRFLKRLYKVPGVKGSFDAVSLHPYAALMSYMRDQIIAIRAIMNKAGDRRAQIWLTEFGWGSAAPTPENSFLKGPQGQKATLIAAYKTMIKNQRKWRIGRTYYFSWADSVAQNSCNLCYSSGLFTAAGQPKPSWYGLVRLTGGTP